MAAVLPAKLRAADCQRFATRAAQLVKFKPIITYWCEYYILQQILAKQLHASDEECSNYALQLMDKLEAFKAENPTNDAVSDDVAAQAYVENFAIETFARADESQRSNAVTRQTADTFSAASVFLDLLSIWGPLEPEIASKAKFAKFHALRISKALKAGEDPNATNPIVEPPPALDNRLNDELSDTELRSARTPADENTYLQPTVESAPDSALPSPPAPVAPSAASPILPTAPQPLGYDSTSFPPASQPEHEVSPVETSDHINSRAGSVGGGYFPSVPETTSATQPTSRVNSTLPTGGAPISPPSPIDFYNVQASPTTLSLHNPDMTSSDRLPHSIPHRTPAQSSAIPLNAPAPLTDQAATMPVHPTAPPGGYKTDDESVMAAQKHAKWAISALNFEDVNTAVKELKTALQSLGAL